MRHLFWCVVLLSGACGREQPASRDSAIRKGMEAEEPLDALPDEPTIPEEIVVEEPLDWQDLSQYLHHVVTGSDPVATDVDARLSEEGRLEIRERERWRAASLDAFARRLERSRGIRYDEAKGGGRVSGIVVGVEVHPSAPWLHLGWLLIVCRECKVCKVQIRANDRTLRLQLPWDAPICGGTEPDPYVHVTVAIRADGYRLGKRSASLGQVVRHLEKAAKTAEDPDLLVCKPDIAADVPVERVMDILAACLDKRIPRLDLDYRIPRQADRRVDVLRRPETGR